MSSLTAAGRVMEPVALDTVTSAPSRTYPRRGDGVIGATFLPWANVGSASEGGQTFHPRVVAAQVAPTYQGESRWSTVAGEQT